MKKIFSILGFILAVSLFATCTKSEQPSLDDIDNYKLKLNINVDANGKTKAVKNAWVNGDKLYVFLQDVSSGNDDAKYLIFTNGGNGNKDWSVEKGGELSNDDILNASSLNKMLYAIYFPFDTPAITKNGDGASFRTSGHTNTALNNLPIFTYYMTNGSGSEFTVTEEEPGVLVITANLSMMIPDGYVQFFVNKKDTHYASNDQYRLSVQGMKPAACTSYSNGAFTHTELEADQPVWGYNYNDEGIAFCGTFEENSLGSSSERKFILFNDEAGATNDGSGTACPAISKTYSLVLNNHDSKRFNPGVPEALVNGWTQAVTTPTVVDVGSETCYWGAWSIGATTPTGIGWYFGWGQIIPSNVNDSYNSLSPEESIDESLTGKYVIFDVARAFLGSDWRMPFVDEANYLNNGTFVYDDEHLELGLCVEINGKSLCFPITYYYKYSPIAEARILNDSRDYGYFWTCQYQYKNFSPYPWYFQGDTDFEEIWYYNNISKQSGLNIRPVKIKSSHSGGGSGHGYDSWDE